MPAKQFDPRKFIDREFEQELFEELFEFKDQSRVLAIKDTGGMGKSYLLQRFQYRCRTVKPRTPVSLIALDQLGENSPLSLVQEINKSLAAFSVEFPGFKEVEMARSAYDFTTIRGKVDLSHANLSQAQEIDIGGVIIKADQVGEINTQPGLSEFTPEQQAQAQQISVQAFLDDLHKHCNQEPVVIMLDAFEKCEPTLREWVVEFLLERYCFNFDQRPAKLLFVIAGREVPDFELYWSIDDCDAVVKSVKSLAKWTPEHVEKCLKVHGFTYSPQQLETFSKMIEIGLPPSQVVQGMQSLLAIRAE